MAYEASYKPNLLPWGFEVVVAAKLDEERLLLLPWGLKLPTVVAGAGVIVLTELCRLKLVGRLLLFWGFWSEEETMKLL